MFVDPDAPEDFVGEIDTTTEGFVTPLAFCVDVGTDLKYKTTSVR
jgi:hypothetical protein